MAHTYLQALATCCTFGLKLLTIETKEKLNCMVQAQVRKYFKKLMLFYYV